MEKIQSGTASRFVRDADKAKDGKKLFSLCYLTSLEPRAHAMLKHKVYN